MLTYASYLKRKTNLTGSGLVGLREPGFEMLAGVGVFAALAWRGARRQRGRRRSREHGVGLAFIAFPIISEMPGGAIFGVLFFLSHLRGPHLARVDHPGAHLLIADKTGWGSGRPPSSWAVMMAIVSIAIMPTATGLSVLDTIDAFTNNLGIVGVALTAIIAVGWQLVVCPSRAITSTACPRSLGPI